MNDNDERPIEVPAMPSHRGPDPRDASAFDAASLPALRAAAADFAWLLSKGYAVPSSLKLIGDRYRLTERQPGGAQVDLLGRSPRQAARTDLPGNRPRRVQPDHRRVQRPHNHRVGAGGAVVLACRDETYRDIAGLHGTYRRVDETTPAIALWGRRFPT